jgi:hypothetical protein
MPTLSRYIVAAPRPDNEGSFLSAEGRPTLKPEDLLDDLWGFCFGSSETSKGLYSKRSLDVFTMKKNC